MPRYDRSDVESRPAIFSRRERVSDMDRISRIRFQCLYLQYAEVGHDWDTTDRPRCDGVHYIHFVESGGAEIQWQGGSMRFAPGRAYWLPAHAPVHARSLGSYGHYFLAFQCEWLASLDLFWDWPTPMDFGTWRADEYVPRWRNPPLLAGDLWRLQNLVEQLFTRAAIPLDEVLARQSALHFKFKPVFDLIENQPNADIHVADLAKAQGVSSAAFTRLFRHHFGTTPKDYFNRQLNQEACRLLLSTDLSSKQIARKLHFSDEYYFSRFFSKLNAVSPARYRHRFHGK